MIVMSNINRFDRWGVRRVTFPFTIWFLPSNEALVQVAVSQSVQRCALVSKITHG